MTPQQEPLSGVIICPVLKEGTAVKGELLHHNQQDHYTPEGIRLSIRCGAGALEPESSDWEGSFSPSVIQKIGFDVDMATWR